MFDELSKSKLYEILMHNFKRDELRNFCKENDIRRGRNKRDCALNLTEAVSKNKIKIVIDFIR